MPISPTSLLSLRPLPMPGPLPPFVAFSAREGELRWFKHPTKVWSLGRVLKVYPGDIRQLGECDLLSEDGDPTVYRCVLSDTHVCDPSHLANHADASLMNNVHEAPLLLLLERRFQAGFIYTFTGDILISVNPYQLVPNLYAMPAPQAAPGVATSLDPGAPRSDPHVFTVAERAFRALMRSGGAKSQALIVSGESGAGKTEACKYVMQYLAHLSHRKTQVAAAAAAAAAGGGPASAREEVTIERRVLNCNPFLEAFGNAKTLRNDNSSRFGKFLRIEYDGEGRISGARLNHYLLEKARVVHPNAGERNYHVFYQLLRGVGEEERRQLLLGDVGDFSYLVGGGGGGGGGGATAATTTTSPTASTFIEGLDDAVEFATTKAALATVGVTPEMQGSIWRVLAAIMHLGNVTFGPSKGGEGGEGEEGAAASSSSSSSSSSSEDARVTNEFSAQAAGKLMGCGGGKLASKLVRRVMRVKGRSSVYEVALTERQACVARDSLAKSLYERLFHWLIRKCNRVLASSGGGSSSSGSGSSSGSSSGNSSGGGASLPFIGILDIFGFEIFESNSFEQLCINYANEKLQSLFNHHIFIAERDAYRDEGLDTSSIAFTSNATCVELLEARGYGLLPALDEVTTLGREDATDGTYLERIDKMHRGRHPNYEDSRRPTPGTFSVAHFAGRVRYGVEGFLEKNNDTLHADLEDLVRGSEDAFVRELFAPVCGGGGELQHGEGGEGGGGASSSSTSSASSGIMVTTIAGKFKSQLQTLYDLLLTTSPHYIRCIKPNPSKRPLSFARRGVLDQLLYCGVLETIRIRQQGFPHREDYLSFWRRACKGGYPRLLAPGRAALYPPLPPPTSTLPLTLIHSHNARAGTLELCSSVLAPSQWAQGRTLLFLRAGGLETLERALRSQCCIVIQAWWRGRVGAGRFRALVRAVVRLQRAYLYRRLKARFAAAELPLARLQAAIRGRRTRRAYATTRASRHAAATLIAATVKSWQTRGAFLQLRSQAVRLQAFARWMAARRECGERRAARDRLGGFLRMVVVRKRYLESLKARERAAAVLQALARGRREKAKYAAFKFALRWLQSRQKCAVAKALAARRRGAAATIHTFCWRAARRREWRGLRATVVRLQAWWRGRRGRQAWVVRYGAAHAAGRFARTSWRARCLGRWCDALFGALAWGDRARARQILLCGSPEYALMGRSVPLACRLNLRNPKDGMKAPLHAAFTAGGAGGEAVTNLLLSFTAGAPNLVALTPRDKGGNTPLHRGAAAGDGHLPSLKALHEALCARGGPGGVMGGDAALAMVNSAGESVLGAAVNAANALAAKMGGGGGGGGSPTHARTIAFLLSRGAAHTGARVPGGAGGQLLSRGRVEELARETMMGPSSQQPPSSTTTSSSHLHHHHSLPPHPHPHYDDMAAIAASVEIAKATEAAREADPHYAFFLVREKERKRREREGAEAAASAARAAAAEAAAQAKERHFPFVLPHAASATTSASSSASAAPGALVKAILASTTSSPIPTYSSGSGLGRAGSGAASSLSLKQRGGEPPRRNPQQQQQRKEPHILTSLMTSLGVVEEEEEKDGAPASASHPPFPPTSPPQPYSKPYYPLSPSTLGGGGGGGSPSSPQHLVMSPRLSQPHAYVLISSSAAHLRGGAQMALLQLLAAHSVYTVTVDVDGDGNGEGGASNSPRGEAITRALAVVPPKARGVFPMLFSRQPKPPGRDFTYLGTWEDVSAAASVGGSGLDAILGGLARVAGPLDSLSPSGDGSGSGGGGGGGALSPINSGRGNSSGSSSSRGGLAAAASAALSSSTSSPTPKPSLLPSSSAISLSPTAATLSPKGRPGPTSPTAATLSPRGRPGPTSPRPPPPRSSYNSKSPPPPTTSPRMRAVATAAVAAAAGKKPPPPPSSAVATTTRGGPVGNKLGSRVMAKLNQESAAKKAAIAATLPLPKRPLPVAAPPAPIPSTSTTKHLLSSPAAAKERELRRGPTGLKGLLLNSPSATKAGGGGGALHALNFGTTKAGPPPPPPPPPSAHDDLPSSPPRQQPSLFHQHQHQHQHQQHQQQQHQQQPTSHSPHSPSILPSKFLLPPGHHHSGNGGAATAAAAGTSSSSSSFSSHLIPNFQGGLEGRGMVDGGGDGGGGGYTTRWEVRQSFSTGMPYYLDTTTGATQWEQPKNLWEMVKKVVVEEDIVGVGEEEEARGNAGEEIHPPSFATAANAPTELPNYGIAGTAPPPHLSSSSSAAAPAATATATVTASAAKKRPPPPIPDLTLLDRAEEWDVKADKSGRPYFVCKALGVSSWLMPPCLQALDTRPQPLAHLDITYGGASSSSSGSGSTTTAGGMARAAAVGLGVNQRRR